VRNNLCYLPEMLTEGQNSQCLLDWNDWLEIGKSSIKGSFFVAQYFLLMTAYFARYFTSAEDQGLEHLKILPEPVFGDEKDFTGLWTRRIKTKESATGLQRPQSASQSDQDPRLASLSSEAEIEEA